MANYIADTAANRDLLYQIATEAKMTGKNGILSSNASASEITKALKSNVDASNNYGTTIGNSTLKNYGYQVDKSGNISKISSGSSNTGSSGTVTNLTTGTQPTLEQSLGTKQEEQQQEDTSYQDQILALMAQQYAANKAAQEAQIAQTVASIEANKDTINSEYEKAQKEAYINSVLQQNQSKDYLAAMGYTGGMTESTLANIINTYENNRANATSERDAALRNNEQLVAEAKTSGDSTLAQLASDYTSDYISALQNQQAYDYQVAQDAQDQANTDREYQLALQQYNDSKTESETTAAQNIAAQDFDTFLNTYQGKYNKKATYEQWIKNLQAMDDPYGYNKQKIAYLRQYINSKFNGTSTTSTPASDDDDDDDSDKDQDKDQDTANQPTAAQIQTYNNFVGKINLANGNMSEGSVTAGSSDRIKTTQLTQYAKEIEAALKAGGLTETQAKALLTMMK